MVYMMLMSYKLKLYFLMLYAFAVVIFPLLLLLLLRILKFVDTIYLTNYYERKAFFLMMSLYYGILHYMFSASVFPGFFGDILKPTVLLIAVMSIIMLIASLLSQSSFKISIHSAGMGAATGFFVVLILLFKEHDIHIIYLSIMIATIVMICRMLDHAHNFIELILGWITGLLSCIGIFFYAY